MGLIVLEGMRFFAYHGVHREESITGGEYQVDVYIDFPFEKNGDELEKTVDYELIYASISKRMQEKVKLIEHLGELMVQDLKKVYPAAQFKLRLSKFNPPVGGALTRAYIEVSA